MSTKKLLDFSSLKDLLSFKVPRAEVSVAGALNVKPSKISRIWADSGYSGRLTYDDLVNAESEIGRTLFGTIPAGYQREFFEHRKNVWIWHESYVDAAGVAHEMTVRYEVRPNGVFKKVSGVEPLIRLQGAELDNFREAARRYLALVKQKLYS